MTEERAPRAADVLERIRADRYPDVPATLVDAVYRLQHSRQFEDERGPTQAAIRDLVQEAANQ